MELDKTGTQESQHVKAGRAGGKMAQRTPGSVGARWDSDKAGKAGALGGKAAMAKITPLDRALRAIKCCKRRDTLVRRYLEACAKAKLAAGSYQAWTYAELVDQTVYITKKAFEVQT